MAVLGEMNPRGKLDFLYLEKIFIHSLPTNNKLEVGRNGRRDVLFSV
jgi:hypothetical protein